MSKIKQFPPKGKDDFDHSPGRMLDNKRSTIRITVARGFDPSVGHPNFGCGHAVDTRQE